MLDELLAQRERAPGEVRRSLMTQITYAKNDADLRQRLNGQSVEEARGDGRTFFGTASMIIDQIGAYVDVGVERFMLQWLDLDDTDRLEAIARDVLPHFHTDEGNDAAL